MYRKMVMAKNGMVSSAHPLASKTGVEILKEGGDAVDAAVAVNAVLTVTQPGFCGIGGDLFCLLYRANTGKVIFLNASGRSPYRAKRKYFLDQTLKKIKARSILSVTVPGCVDGWSELLGRYGTMNFSEVLHPAIKYAKEGYPISSLVSSMIEKYKNELSQDPDWTRIFLKDGFAPKPAETIVQKDLASVFEQICREGKNSFYKGDLAKAIMDTSKQLGGLLSYQDLADHHSDWGYPVTTNYRGYTVYETPPNTQGLTTLIALNIVENFDLCTISQFSPEHLHYLIEATKLALLCRDRYIADPSFVDIPVNKLLSKKYSKKLQLKINAHRITNFIPRDILTDTTYFAVADKKGNLASCIQSLYSFFGSGVMIKGTGIVLQNRGACFSLNPYHVNVLGPHRRPLHTLMAALIFKRNEPLMAFGSMGGYCQPQIHLQVITNVIDYGMNIQEAIEAPRWVYGDMEKPTQLMKVEGGISRKTIDILRTKGYLIEGINRYSQQVGHAQGIMIDPETKVFMGGADPRGDGCAVGW